MRSGQSTEAEHRAYYEAQFASNAEFWRRFGARPALDGRRVLDLGCGHGAMSLEAAQAGADVLGVDLDEGRVAFAREHVAPTPGLPGALEFRVVDLHDLDADAAFDVVLSKDTFEHVADMRAMARAIARVLKPGGELWAGFAPLYHSPFGDHGRTGLRRVPWAHVVLPDALVLRSAARHQGMAVRRLEDIGLNGMTPREFREHLAGAGLEPVSIGYNRGSRPLMGTLARARRIPALERFATVGIYAVARRT